MLGMLFRRAQATVDHAVGQALMRAVVAIPFLIAAGFGTAALSMRLNREFGAETGSLILAFGFVLLGLLTALIVYLRSTEAQNARDEPADTNGSAEAVGDADPTLISGVDRELIAAALTSAAPLAVPAIMRMFLRNLPLVAAVAAAVFVISRDNGPGIPEPGE
jgi:hypothetical protein